MPPGSRAGLRGRRPAQLVRPRAGCASTAPANPEDVGGPRAPPRRENDLGREVTCPLAGGATATKEAEGRWVGFSGGTDASPNLRYVEPRACRQESRGPGSAWPRPHYSRPPVTTVRRGPGGAPASPRRPSRPSARRLGAAKSARASGCPAPGAGDPRLPARAPPAPPRSPWARLLLLARGPGARKGRIGSRERVLEAGAGGGFRTSGQPRPTPPQRRQPGPAGACGRRVVGNRLRSPGVRARCGDGNTGNRGSRRISELREIVWRPAFIQTPATGVPLPCVNM
ncbi:uncharacterized protein LOC144579607 [Callithrix jacchus]